MAVVHGGEYGAVDRPAVERQGVVTDEFAQVKSLEPPADIIELSLKINQILKILKGD